MITINKKLKKYIKRNINKKKKNNLSIKVLTEDQILEASKGIMQDLNDKIYGPLYYKLNNNQILREQLNPAFPFPRELRIGLLDTGLVVEHVGPEDDTTEAIASSTMWKPEVTLNEFLGVDIDHLGIPIMPFPQGISNISNTSFFLGDSINYLCDYFYDFVSAPIDSYMNIFFDFSQIKTPVILSNISIFWTDSGNKLKIRQIDFLEIFPRMNVDGWGYHREDSFENLLSHIINTKMPKFDVKLHNVLNNFIELINLDVTKETDITRFLHENPEIISLAFGTHSLNAETLLEWQYPTDHKNLKPDFLPQKMDGYCDIIEFKLPNLKSNPVVGISSRLQPSHEIDSAISQVELYKKWFSQEVNNRWLEKEKGIKCLEPRLTIVIGHSKDFSAEDRQRIRSIRNPTIYTYDEFIEMTRYQLYRVR